VPTPSTPHAPPPPPPPTTHHHPPPPPPPPPPPFCFFPPPPPPPPRRTLERTAALFVFLLPTIGSRRIDLDHMPQAPSTGRGGAAALSPQFPGIKFRRHETISGDRQAEELLVLAHLPQDSAQPAERPQPPHPPPPHPPPGGGGFGAASRSKTALTFFSRRTHLSRSKFSSFFESPLICLWASVWEWAWNRPSTPGAPPHLFPTSCPDARAGPLAGKKHPPKPPPLFGDPAARGPPSDCCVPMKRVWVGVVRVVGGGWGAGGGGASPWSVPFSPRMSSVAASTA